MLKQALNGGTSTTVNDSISSSATSLTVSGLSDGAYVYQLYAVDAYTNTSNAGASSSLTIDTTAPAAPSLTAVKTTQRGNSIALSWTESDSVSKYVLKRTLNGGSAITVNDSISSSATSLTVSGLSDGAYVYQLYAVDAYTNTSNAGTSSSLTIDTTAPSAPTLTAVKSSSNGNSIALSWGVPSATSKFYLTRSGTGGTVVVSSNILNSVTSLTQSGLSDGSYTYSIYAVDAYTNTSNAGVSSALTIDTSGPGAPTLMAAKISSNGNSIALSWTVPTSTVKFILKRSLNGATAVVVESNLSSTVTSLTRTGLRDATYQYFLYAMDAYNNSSEASISAVFTIDTSAPYAPTNFVGVVNGSAVNLSWVNPTANDFASVTIRRSTAGYPSTITEGSEVLSDSLGTSVTDSGLGTGTYYYSIFAKDTWGNVSEKATVMGSVDVTAPGVPTHLIGIATANAVTLAWTNPTDTDFSSVMLRRSSVSAPANTTEGTLVQANLTGGSYTDSNRVDGTYYYSVFAKDETGNYSSAASVTVRVSVPKFTGTGGLLLTKETWP